jgi:hypothetical protein
LDSPFVAEPAHAALFAADNDEYRSELAFVPRTSRFWSHSPEAVSTIHAYGDLVEDLHFTG